MSKSSDHQSYQIRPSKGNDETMLVWYDFMLNLGWDRGPSDLSTYLDHSKSRGMILAFSKSSTVPIGHVAAVINENSTGWVALFIVAPEYQGLGIGAGLWSNMIQDFQHCGTEFVGLDAVPQQKGTYERRGFVDSKLGVVEVMTRPFNAKFQEASMPLMDIRGVSAHLLAQYELKYTGFYRPKVWENLLGRTDVVGYVNSSTGSPQSVDDITACAVLRRCPGGSRLGPVYGNDAVIAEQVIRAILSSSTPEYVRDHPLDRIEMSGWSANKIESEAVINAEVWTGNPASKALFEKLGWKSGGHYNRMWLNDKATPAQSEGGAAQLGLFAIFDAAAG